MAKKSLSRQPKSGLTKKRKKQLPPGVVEKHGKWYVRIRYREDGRRHAAWRECAKNATDAKDVRKKLERELEEKGPQVLRQSKRNFGELADYYRDNHLIEARYVDGRKVAGRRSWKTRRYELEVLRNLIGPSTKLRDIDYSFLRRLRLSLIDKPVIVKKWAPKDGKRKGEKVDVPRQRSMISIDRYLELLRHVLNVARKELQWIHHNPFGNPLEPLITRSDERKRRRVMSFVEEDALLAVAVGPREHLRIVIIGLVDTLTRSKEFFKLRVRDLDPERIVVQQMNTKTLRQRLAPKSARFAAEFRRWAQTKHLTDDDRLFDFESVRTAFRTAKRLAGITDLRLKDLRRTGATRLLRQGLTMEELSQILGHTTVEMTYDYIGIDRDTTLRANELLDGMHARRDQLELIH